MTCAHFALLVIHPERFAARLLDGMTILLRCFSASPSLVKSIHEIAAITGDGNLASNLMQNFCKLRVVVFGHFIAICSRVSPALVRIRRIAIEKGSLVIV